MIGSCAVTWARETPESKRTGSCICLDGRLLHGSHEHLTATLASVTGEELPVKRSTNHPYTEIKGEKQPDAHTFNLTHELQRVNGVFPCEFQEHLEREVRKAVETIHDLGKFAGAFGVAFNMYAHRDHVMLWIQPLRCTEWTDAKLSGKPIEYLDDPPDYAWPDDTWSNQDRLEACTWNVDREMEKDDPSALPIYGTFTKAGNRFLAQLTAERAADEEVGMDMYQYAHLCETWIRVVYLRVRDDQLPTCPPPA
jgi:hypothetical protein